MSRDDIEIVRRCYDAFMRHYRGESIELADWLELFDLNGVLDFSRRVFNPAVYRGYEGFKELIEAVDVDWAELEIVPTEVLDAPEHVFAAVHVSARGNSSGIEIDTLLYDVWTLREGRALLLRSSYQDRREALDAAGLTDG